MSKQLNRRTFVTNTGATLLASAVLPPKTLFGTDANAKIRFGLIGCGGRGSWIADHFVKNGNYNLVAAADYFPDRVNAFGGKFEVPEKNRFTGLSGYRRLLEQKLDAVVIQSPPYFHPEQVAAAIAAGKHVYCAKPVAVDVPGCLSIEESGKKARASNLVFLVDFQTRANLHYQRAIQLVREGLIGKLVSGEATYFCGPTFGGIASILRKNPSDPETQLRAWGLSRELSGDVITEQNIHALDVACWIIGANPVSAFGTGGEVRGLGGNCWDHFSVIYRFPDDVSLSFSSKQYGHGWDDICCRMYGVKGTIDTHYFGVVKVRGAEDGYSGGPLHDLYTEGAVNNIASFAEQIYRRETSNRTVAESIRSNLTTILGRTAAHSRNEVSWAEMMHANEKLTFDLSGLRT
ncbi:MAG: Gfo/Idh/MocA family protein [Limisphaerales bacterium]